MLKFSRILIPGLILISVLCSGCVKQSANDIAIQEAVQAYIDSNGTEDVEALTPEERAVIESFEIYKNILKIQLVQGSDGDIWDPMGRKVMKAFAYACREHGQLDTNYFGEFSIMAELDGETSNFKVADLNFSNQSERCTVELYNISRSNR